MAGLVNGLYQLGETLQQLLLPGMGIAILLAALSALIQGDNWRVVIKERMVMVCVVGAIGFGAAQLAKMVATWFM